MKYKKNIIVGVLVYITIACVLFVKNNVSASQRSNYEKVVKQEKIVDQDKRAMLRAFYTAPPVVPHDIESEDSRDCLRCHLNVTKTEDERVAMQTPHPQLSSCLQCHVPTNSKGELSQGSQWQGLKEPKRGDRWFTVSPPTMPHRVTLRENCLSCHGPENPDMRLRTSHPERTSCLQCHVPNYQNEFEIKRQ